jgi:phosphatidylinositol alpha 1,6-mannosyltransferase
MVLERRRAAVQHSDPRSLRLALFTDSFIPQLNGVALLLGRLVEAVRARGATVRVYTTSDPAGAEADDVRRWPSVAFWAYPEHRLALPTQPRVRRELLAWRPTLVHAASPFGMGLAARAAARALGVPFVTSYHTNWSAYSSFYQMGALRGTAWHYLRWFHNGGARTYCPTQAVQDELAARGFQHMALWSRGVDSARFNPLFRSAALRARLGVTDDMVLAIYVGRLGAEKGLGIALQGMREVMEAAPGRVRCAIAGDGPYADEARAMAPEGTVFMGRLTGDALSEFYASADVFMFPSATDTFGNVLLEAMASGLPVVGADVGPTRELLAGRNGVTFVPGDAADFARRMLELVTDAGWRASLGRNALGFARQCTWDRVWDALVDDYCAVMGGVLPAA